MCVFHVSSLLLCPGEEGGSEQGGGASDAEGAVGHTDASAAEEEEDEDEDSTLRVVRPVREAEVDQQFEAEFATFMQETQVCVCLCECVRVCACLLACACACHAGKTDWAA